MVPPSRSAVGDGRAHARTTAGPAYQVPVCTGRIAGTGWTAATAGREEDHDHTPRVPVVRRGALILALLAVLAIAGCGAGSSYASFDPTSACTTDGRFPGAYPDLEARLPARFDGRGPDSRDSGRNCTAAELGTLAGHGIHEIRYAGATWELGGRSGVTLAAFTGSGLTAEWLGEWYEAGARAARKTRKISPTRPTMAGRQAYRLDTVNDDSVQTVITWDAPSGDAVYVVVAADVPEARIQEALAAFPPGG
jgi:hypothetical protein